MEDKIYKITIKGFFGHLNTINKHRFMVFRLCCKAGIPIQGLLHDLSKYSPIEFWEGVKYFQGTYSPIQNCKRVNGYSEAWLHHKGRNKHHYEYWYDSSLKNNLPVMSFKYYEELICDSLSAGMVYKGKEWNIDYELKYWNMVRDKGYVEINKKMELLITKTYEEIADKGLDFINKKNLKKLYDQYIN